MAAASDPQCAGLQAHRYLSTIEAYDVKPGAPRVFAMQYKQDLRNLSSYASFEAKIDCMIQDVVLPRLAVGRPNVVVFNEDIGLATIAVGTRGAAARAMFSGPVTPSCESQGLPCSTVAALGSVTAAYAPQIAAYHRRFPTLGSLSQAYVGATDTLVRAFVEPFSRLAKKYGIYIGGSGDLPLFAVSSDPVDVATFADPDMSPRPSSVYVATQPEVYNHAYLWGPTDLRSDGPAALRNVVSDNLKVPLTPIEQQFQFSPGPSSGPEAIKNLEPYTLPGTATKVAFATSLPAFTYGTPPPGVDPCSDTSQYYMRCLDKLGANVVLQDEANGGGRWTGYDGDGIEQWQPLSWMESTWRAVSDPSVHFSYNVTPMMVGNLADLDFDGQSAITQRGLTGPGCHYIGNSAFVVGEDEEKFRRDAGPKSEFLALAPWVKPDASRDSLRAVGAKLAAGSGDALENDYLETSIAADLPQPPDSTRTGCITAAPPG